MDGLDWDGGVGEAEGMGQGLKSLEEIERLTIDENMEEIPRQLLILRSAHSARIASVFYNLPYLLSSYPRETLTKILPSLMEALKTSSMDLSIFAAQRFSDIADHDEMTADSFHSTLLPLIFTKLDSRDSSQSRAWLSSLLACIPKLYRDDRIVSAVTEAARSRSHLSKPKSARLAGCQIIGALAEVKTKAFADGKLLENVVALCQDTDYEVRMAMCVQLKNVSICIGIAATGDTLVEELIELSEDEELKVRCVAIEAIVELLGLVDEETRKARLAPLLFGLYETINESVYVSDWELTCSRIFGAAFHFLYSHKEISEEHYDIMMKYYNDISTSDVPEIRLNAAYNMPAMVATLGSSKFEEILKEPFMKFCSDTQLIKNIMASSMHAVLGLFSPNEAGVYFQRTLITFFESGNIGVLEMLVQHLDDIFRCLSSEDKMERYMFMSDFVSPLLEFEKTVSKKWRLHLTFFQQISNLPEYMSSEQIYSKFIPMLFALLKNNRALPIKAEAVKFLANLIRKNRKLEQRLSLTQRLVDEFGRGKSYWDRLTYIDISEHLIGLFSRRYAKDYLYMPLLDLARDSVINVCLRLCKLLPTLKRLARLPNDQNIVTKLDEALEVMKSRDDRDLSELANEIEIELYEISPDGNREDDIVDQCKEDEEKLMLRWEEQDIDASKKQDEERIRAKWAAMERSDMGGKKLTPQDMERILRAQKKRAVGKIDRPKVSKLSSTTAANSNVGRSNSLPPIGSGGGTIGRKTSGTSPKKNIGGLPKVTS